MWQAERVAGRRTPKVVKWLGWGLAVLVGLYGLWYLIVLLSWNFTGDYPGR
ncbi:hypothetical protein [Actinoplanes sp. NPDC051494]|uniref:hypothetical protein n=1 Tax=Actinoplanes sp. NPDC051494 TaxID=3363907 RepID=UPI0037AAE7FE